jgi:hypothetical protein
MKLWIGKEKEGMYKKFITLFIGSYDININEIIKYTKEYRIAQLYFGAGGCTKINKKLVLKCIKLFKNMIITLEIDINMLNKYKELLKEEIGFMITSTNKNFLLLHQINKYKIQIKIQSLNNKKLIAITDWEKFDKIDVKKLKGKIYKGDIVFK